MRISCIFLLLAGLIALVIESSDSASLEQRNYELAELKLLKELVESYKRAQDVRQDGGGEGDGENGPDGENEPNSGDQLPSPGGETGQGEGGPKNTEGGAEGGEPSEDDEGEEGESPDQGEGETGTTTEGPAGPPDANEEGPSGQDRAGISKDFADNLASIEEQVLKRVFDILNALDAKDLEEANAKVGFLLDQLEAMSKDANEFLNFLDIVRKHLHDGKNSLKDIVNAFHAAEGIIRIGENRKPLDNGVGEESERQAKGELGIPVTRAVGGEPIKAGVPVARAVEGGLVEVGVPVARAVEGERQTIGEVEVPVARASGDGPIDKKVQLLREVRLLNLLKKMLKDATKK